MNNINNIKGADINKEVLYQVLKFRQARKRFERYMLGVELPEMIKKQLDKVLEDCFNICNIIEDYIQKGE